jgi:membrane protein implicated in regulation of membrane protease activity
MQDYEWWWVLAGLLGVAEVMTGTFYILVLAISAVAASILAKMGFAVHWQVLGAALVALSGWFWLRQRKSDGSNSPAQDLDVGEWVEVESWSDGVGSAQYRGAHWNVEAHQVDALPSATGVAPNSNRLVAGRYRIRALRGNRLIVDVKS